MVSELPPCGSFAEIPVLESPATGSWEGTRDLDEGQWGRVQLGRATGRPYC